MTEDVCLIGFGAIGAIYAFALERSSKARVTAVCRSNYETIQAHGLEIISDKLGAAHAWKPYRVVRNLDEAADRNYAFIICAAKCIPEVNPTPVLLAPLLRDLSSSPDTTIILLQNGIGIEDDLQDYFVKKGLSNVIISGCAWIDTTAVNGGQTVTQYGNERLVLGYHRPPVSPAEGVSTFSESKAQDALTAFSNLLRSGGTSPDPVEDVDVARWRKVLWNASFSTLCTLSRCTVGDLLAVSHGRLALAKIMAEVLAIAHASLPPHAAALLPSSVIDEIINHENPASTFKPSMLVDLESSRPMEVEAIVGGVLKRAWAAGVEAPRLETVYAGLAVIQRKLLEKREGS